ncbi:hypothetical protein CLV24_11599 [Pontibacter ummariensis]|uniref:Uncharacterized protein n=1 Tax=Pontibacter ummariensis TaxID=1610492 RepID=A0A239I5I4_9BACT|nr:hypothetical protein [Pontibacter ummariensis]PRY10182.1 hypothetical protein CLV24_11599 [Pontibacter ummariensis]SNS87594.1 hypothetical protein SAMN06296052_11599 [Pontibacter ummariensis]
MKPPAALYLLGLLHLLLGLNGLVGGALLILEPRGSLLGMSTAWLGHSPFSTYLLPGILLLFCMGVFPLLTLVGLLFKPDWAWAGLLNIYPAKHWAWTYSLFTGILTVTWITVQIVLTTYFWLQPLVMIVGLGIVVFTMLPEVISYFTISKERHARGKV